LTPQSIKLLSPESLSILKYGRASLQVQRPCAETGFDTAAAEGHSGVPRNFYRGGVQQIHLRIEDRENGDLGAVAP